MQIVIDILENQIKISEERLKIKHYPVIIEPGVRMKIEACKDAINILDSERIKRTESLNNHKSQPSSFFAVGQAKPEVCGRAEHNGAVMHSGECLHCGGRETK